jgi:D-cysteine desulfhydrase
VHRLGGEAAADLGLDPPGREDVDVRDGWAGKGYGIPSREGHAATELLARTEGVLLDPVFGAKAMAALMAEARGGRCRDPVVFLVTGGAPTLFVRNDDGGGL